jgi:hypothetical protein
VLCLIVYRWLRLHVVGQHVALPNDGGTLIPKLPDDVFTNNIFLLICKGMKKEDNKMLLCIHG